MLFTTLAKSLKLQKEKRHKNTVCSSVLGKELVHPKLQKLSIVCPWGLGGEKSDQAAWLTQVLLLALC